MASTTTADDVDDAHYRCTPPATVQASTTSKQTNSLNNNKAASAGSGGTVKDNVSPYLVSAAASPRKKHTRTVMTASGNTETTKTLPPLDLNRTVLHGNGALLHHHSTRRSARKSSRSGGGGHSVPVMNLNNSSNKRSHSAASTQDDTHLNNHETPTPPSEAAAAASVSGYGTAAGRRSRGHHYRGHSHSPERKSSKVLCTPEKLARRGHHIYSKIDTVRILRARPAFYPIRDKISTTTSSSAKSSAKSSHRDHRHHRDGQHVHQLHHHQPPDFESEMLFDSLNRSPILGKHITLRMDRSELKRKRRVGAGSGGGGSTSSTNLALPPATTSTHFT